MWWFKNFLVVVLVTFSMAVGEQDDILVISTEYGRVRGTQNATVEQNNTYFAFRGIPYAAPPIKNLRFEPPVPPAHWDDIVDATQDQNVCVQGASVFQNLSPVQGSEDCLYLNVYTPTLPSSEAANPNLPVMVWIYGGGFTLGNTLYTQYGPDYFLDQKVVVVSINYRVGIFGFITTNDLVAPGNGGLKDQAFGLAWVQRNIAKFGGDPNSVTIFGQSAGSASVAYHLQSQLSKGLFHKAILQSGTSLCLWSLSRRMQQSTVETARKLNINTSSSKSLVEGLKTIDYTTLQRTSSLTSDAIQLSIGFSEGLIIAPVIEPQHENAFLSNRSYELLRRGDFEKVPVIVGYTTLEGNFYNNLIVSIYFERYDLEASNLTPIDMNIQNRITKMQVGLSIRRHYYGLIPIALNSPNTYRFLSEDQFVRPIHETMKLFSQYVNVFCYRYSYEGQLGGVDHTSRKGVQHAEELGYFWRQNNSTANASVTDQLTRARSVKLWTNFAKFGNPTPDSDPLFQNVSWPLYQKQNSKTVSCLDIGNNLTIVNDPNFDAVLFYQNLYTRYGRPPYDTY